VTEEKFIGHILSKDGLQIDPKRVTKINKVPKTRNVKGIQSFFGQVNFLRRFVTNFAEISRPISKIPKKEETINWEGVPIVAF
jgi:hypothetical protein